MQCLATFSLQVESRRKGRSTETAREIRFWFAFSQLKVKEGYFVDGTDLVLLAKNLDEVRFILMFCFDS